MQAGGGGEQYREQGANAQRHEGPLDPPEKGRPGQVRGLPHLCRPQTPGLRRVWMALGTWQEPAGLEEACPWSLFWEKKRNYGEVGGPGLSARPEGPAMLRLRLSLPSNNLGSEKYWRPWLTELFFRFEQAPFFDSDPAEHGKRFPKPPPARLPQLGSASPGERRSNNLPSCALAPTPGGAYTDPAAAPSSLRPGWSRAEDGWRRGGCKLLGAGVR